MLSYRHIQHGKLLTSYSARMDSNAGKCQPFTTFLSTLSTFPGNNNPNPPSFSTLRHNIIAIARLQQILRNRWEKAVAKRRKWAQLAFS